MDGVAISIVILLGVLADVDKAAVVDKVVCFSVVDKVVCFSIAVVLVLTSLAVLVVVESILLIMFLFKKSQYTECPPKGHF